MSSVNYDGEKKAEKDERGKSEDHYHNTKVDFLTWTMKLSARSVFRREWKR